MKLFSQVVFKTFCAIFIFLSCNILAVAHEWMAPDDAAEIPNPLTESPEIISYGKDLYQRLCSHCHGSNMTGLPTQHTGLTQHAPNLKARLKTHSDGDFFWKIQRGRGEMPAFRDELEAKEVWSILKYIRSEIK